MSFGEDLFGGCWVVFRSFDVGFCFENSNQT